MTELCGDEAYGSTYMKKKLIDLLGSSIVIAELDRKHNVVFFKTAADSILYSFHKKSEKDNTESENNYYKDSSKAYFIWHTIDWLYQRCVPFVWWYDKQ